MNDHLSSRPATVYESPYELKADEDIWAVYDRLRAAKMPHSFEIIFPDTSRKNLLQLEEERLGL